MNDIDLEVFQSGNYGEKGNYTIDDIDLIASDYNPSVHESPVTVDHAQTGQSFGWVASLKRVGNKLIARLKNLNPKLIEFIKSGAFKKRSIELYKNFKNTGRPYLRAISFLGAQIPEVKSLSDPLFKEENNSILSLEQEFPNLQPENMDLSKEANPNDEQKIDLTQDSSSKTLSEALPLRNNYESPLNEMKKELRKKEILSFCETAKQQGKILPAWEKEGLVEFLVALDDIPVFCFGENEALSPYEWFMNFIKSLPAMVCFNEVATPSKSHFPQLPTSPKLSNNLRIDSSSIELHNKAVSFMEQNPGISYVNALLLISQK